MKCDSFNEAYVFKRPMDHKAHLSNTINYEHFRVYTIAGCFHITHKWMFRRNIFWGWALGCYTPMWNFASLLGPLHLSVGHRDALLVYRTFLMP